MVMVAFLHQVCLAGGGLDDVVLRLVNVCLGGGFVNFVHCLSSVASDCASGFYYRAIAQSFYVSSCNRNITFSLMSLIRIKRLFY